MLPVRYDQRLSPPPDYTDFGDIRVFNFEKGAVGDV